MKRLGYDVAERLFTGVLHKGFREALQDGAGGSNEFQRSFWIEGGDKDLILIFYPHVSEVLLIIVIFDLG
jgi:hypothetical protein